VIGKKVLNAKGRGSKAARIGSLLDYIRAPHRVKADEKCAYYGARGFVTDSPGGHRAEMVALAQDAVRSADPVNHYILSWREGEVPLAAQVEQAVTLFLSELGLGEHQAVYGLHSDTDNLHLHIAVNRVHPESLRVMKIHGGFDLEAVHRAIARIEHAQGWLPERRARYQVRESGELVRSAQQHAEARQPTQAKCDREAHSGYRSAERIAIEEAAPIIASASCWNELHLALAERGMRYERTGSGAKVFVGDAAVKASRVARDASLGKLVARLGPYHAAPGGLQVAAVRARPLRPELPGWEQYSEQRARHYAEKKLAWQQLRERLKRERRDLNDRQRTRRAEVLSGDFAGRGHLLNALRASLSQEQRVEAQAQRHEHADARERLRMQYAPFPSIERWLREQGKPAVAEQWRYREVTAQLLTGPAPMPPQQNASTYAKYATDWKTQEDGRRDALKRVWSQYGRDVDQLKSASKHRWAFVKLVAKGSIGSKLWALNARMADQHAWRRLHERHRAALAAADERHPPLEWRTWLGNSAKADEHASTTSTHIVSHTEAPSHGITGGSRASRFADQPPKRQRKGRSR
jgi:hypothetical protein